MNSSLPEVIWIPGRVPAVYEGTPYEMVRSMASEMASGLEVYEAVEHLLAALAQNRDLVIGLPADIPEEDLARLFIVALLDTGFARTLAVA